MAASNEDRELFLSRKDDFVWLDDTAAFQCVRCDKVLFQHYISNCSHKFCLNCKKILDDGSRGWKCPLPSCKATIEDINLQDYEFDQKLFELRAYCPNHKYGCLFTGQLKDIGAHLKSCEDTRERALPVIYEKNDKLDNVLDAIREMNNKLSKFDEKFEAMDSAFHEIQNTISEITDKEKSRDKKLAEFDSRINSLSAKFDERINSLPAEFDKRIINSSAGFDSRINSLSAKFEKRINSLPSEFDTRINNLSAEFYKRINSLSVEYEDKMAKMSNGEAEKARENAAEILKLKGKSETWFQMLELKDEKYHKRLEELKTEVGKIKNEIPEEKKFKNQEDVKNIPKPNKLAMVNDCYKEKPDYTLEITSVKGLITKKTTSISSEVFPLRRYPFGARVQVAQDSNGEYNFSLSYKFLEKTNKYLKVKPNPRIFWTFKDQSGNKDVVHSGLNLFGYQLQFNKIDTNYGFNDFMVNDICMLKSPLYVVNGKMLIDIRVETPEVARLTYSHNGSLEWTLDDYRNRRQMEEDGLVEGYVNPYFYTSQNGYRVLVNSYLNGNDKYENRGLTIEINFVNGLYDDNLSTSFPHKTSVTVFNPIEPHRKISRSVQKDIGDDLYYSINIGTHQQIENLLNNDTLTYHVTIEAL